MIGISPIAGPTPACKLCETKSTDPNFLLFVQFGTALSPSKRQRIEQYINDVIYPQHQPSSRKRGRHDYDYESEYSDYSSSYDRRKRQRTANGYRQSAQSSDSPTLVIYDPEAGFSLDTTTDTLDAPLDYKHGVTAILGADATGLGNPCFNCSIPGHEMRDCPWPLDHDKIEANRLEFKDKRGVGPFDSRLYLVVEEEKRRDEMRQKFRPGQMSEELREALGLREGEVAPFVKSMRYAGYPPAYLGSSEGQDPMEARPRDVPPPTPLLKIYDSIEELANEPAQKTKTTAAAAAADDGEDGAISDDEEGAITDDDDDEGAIDEAVDAAQPSASQPPRNIPLVHYPGLDLSILDFEHAGRPKPQRQSQASGYSSYHNGSYQYGNDGDDWSGMLDGYYRQADSYNAQSPLQYWQQPVLYAQPIAQPPPPPADPAPPPPLSPPPPLPPVDHNGQSGISRVVSEEPSLPSVSAQDRITQDQQSASEPILSDGELEDGECDMDTGD